MDVAILIGGKGLRTKKISEKIPKSFLKLNNKSIIERQLKNLKHYKRIFILSNKKISKYNNKLSNKNIVIIEEEKPLGNAGCLKNLIKYKKLNDNILIISGDLVFNLDIKKFENFHKKNKSEITYLVHPNDHITDSDAIEINNKNQLIKFHKKPHTKKDIGNLCLSGIMIIKKKILDHIKENKFQSKKRGQIQKATVKKVISIILKLI